MKNKIVWQLVFGIILLGMYSCGRGEQEKQEETPPDPVTTVKYGFPIDDYRVVTDTVAANETLSDILSKYNVSAGRINTIAEKSKDVFSVRNFRPNHQYTLLFCSEDSLAAPNYFIYEKNLAEYVVYDLVDSITVSVETRPRETRTDIYGNTITSSLWNSLTENGKSPALAMELAEVYQWSIDFYTIQKGDSYDVIYTQDYVDDKPLGNIRPLAAKFVHQDSAYYAYWFEEGKIKGYFDENGGSLHKAFLKAPLKFSRISSRFSGSRFHPVLKYRRAHRGVDYAAPTGTPVRAVGDGKIIKKAYQRGGAGNYVKIKHNKTYTTVYMHFVRHAKGIHTGKHVRQGDIIGYVGMTGSATGPHLHFGVVKNGKYINPLSMKSPPLKPLSGEILELFKHRRDSIQGEFGECGI